MNTSGEAADQVVRMSLEVGEAALKISGEGAKQLAVLLYAVLQDQSKSMAKSKGKTRLETLVRTGKPLKVFSVKESDLKKFAKEAKRYGILYCAILLFFKLFTASCCTLFTTIFKIILNATSHYSSPIMHIKYCYPKRSTLF